MCVCVGVWECVCVSVSRGERENQGVMFEPESSHLLMMCLYASCALSVYMCVMRMYVCMRMCV